MRRKEDISYFLAELEKNLNKYHTIIISFVHLPLSSNENTCLKMIKWRSFCSFRRSLNKIFSVGIRFVELWPSQEAAIHIAISAEMKIALGIIFNFAFNIKLDKNVSRVDLLTHWVYRKLDWWNFLFSSAASVTSNIESNIKVLRLQDNFHPVLYTFNT